MLSYSQYKHLCSGFVFIVCWCLIKPANQLWCIDIWSCRFCLWSYSTVMCYYSFGPEVYCFGTVVIFWMKSTISSLTAMIHHVLENMIFGYTSGFCYYKCSMILQLSCAHGRIVMLLLIDWLIDWKCALVDRTVTWPVIFCLLIMYNFMACRL